MATCRQQKERKSLEVKVVDWAKELRYYITAWQQVGYGIHNSGGVAELEFTGSMTVEPTVPLS